MGPAQCVQWETRKRPCLKEKCKEVTQSCALTVTFPLLCTYIHTLTYTYTQIYITERERERRRQREREIIKIRK